MGAEHKVLRRFAFAGARVDITREQLAALCLDKLPPRLPLSGEGIRGRAVHNERSPCRTEIDGGRIRHPEILTDLNADFELRQALAGKEQSRPKRQPLPEERHQNRGFKARRKVAALVKLAVIRNVKLRHKTEQLPLLKDRDRIVKSVLKCKRQTDKAKYFAVRRVMQQLPQLPEHRFLQRVLQKQIPAGVGAQRELGEHQYLGSPSRFAPNDGLDLLPVVSGVCNPHGRRRGCDAEKPVSHAFFSLPSPGVATEAVSFKAVTSPAIF